MVASPEYTFETLSTEMYQGLVALSTKMYQGLVALSIELYLGLAALSTELYLGLAAYVPAPGYIYVMMAASPITEVY